MSISLSSGVKRFSSTHFGDSVAHHKGLPEPLKLEDHVRPRKRQGKPPVISKEELNDLYWTRDMLPMEIAKLKGCTSWWISILMSRYGIPKRGISLSMKLMRKKGVV